MLSKIYNQLELFMDILNQEEKVIKEIEDIKEIDSVNTKTGKKKPFPKNVKDQHIKSLKDNFFIKNGDVTKGNFFIGMHNDTLKQQIKELKTTIKILLSKK